MALEITSSAFAPHAEIPRRYTCDGEDVSPPLQWRGVPPNAKSLALIVDDPDAPDPKAPKMTYVHWVVVDMPPSTSGLPEGASGKKMPAGAHEGVNDWKKTGYGGPCPPIGRHRYFFKLYALDQALKLDRPTKPDLEKAMQGHIVAKAELMGTYQHPK